MAIKTNDITLSPEKTLPILMKSTSSNLVVLFFGTNAGIVVIGDKDYFVGAYSDRWENYRDESIWELFRGDIIISNEQDMCDEYEFYQWMRKGIRKIHLLNMLEKSKALLYTEEGVENFEAISEYIEKINRELSYYGLYE